MWKTNLTLNNQKPIFDWEHKNPTKENGNRFGNIIIKKSNEKETRWRKEKYLPWNEGF